MRLPTPPISELRALTPQEFKRSPKMMTLFASYEDYMEKIGRPFMRIREMDLKIQERENFDKIEALEPWQIPVKRVKQDE